MISDFICNMPSRNFLKHNKIFISYNNFKKIYLFYTVANHTYIQSIYTFTVYVLNYDIHV